MNREANLGVQWFFEDLKKLQNWQVHGSPFLGSAKDLCASCKLQLVSSPHVGRAERFCAETLTMEQR